MGRAPRRRVDKPRGLPAGRAMTFVGKIRKIMSHDPEPEQTREDLPGKVYDRQYDGALVEAALQGDYERARTLLEKGADPNAHDDIPDWYQDQSALMFAARAGHLEIVRLLLEKGADPNAIVCSCRQTAMAWAASHGQTDQVQLLKQAGAKE